MYAQGKAQKRPEKTLNLHLRLTLSTKTACNNQRNKNTNQQTKPVEGESHFQSTTLLDSNTQCFTKRHKAYKEKRKA